jgi:dolichol-phosphate mannosyltransferase
MDVRNDGRAASVISRKRVGRFLGFGLVGITGLVVNQAALFVFTSKLGIYYLLSAVIATQCSTVWNFVLVERLVYDGPSAGRGRRFVWFALMNNAWLILRVPILFALTERAGLSYLWSNAIALCTATVLRFAIADSMIWGAERVVNRPRHYDIHGLVRVVSDARLPELERFEVDEPAGQPDLVVEIGKEGFGGLRRRAEVIEKDDVVSYVEHLGWLGFAIRVHVNDPVRVQASPLLGRSPHVLYTNVVEPLLRWTVVRKGRILAHAACLEVDGRGVLITARTDTGKTTTCLKSIKEHGARFVSDDMVIVDPAGSAYAFPKPLTISAHTLRAIRGAPLSVRRRAWLQVQGRLHSRFGRSVGLAMSRANLPVATMNALVQIVVPPPKFHVDELIPGAEVVSSIPLEHLFVIERGSALVEDLDVATANMILSENTEDAYGFPPYPRIAHALANGEVQMESEMRRTMLDGLRATRLRTPDRSWFALLPELLSGKRDAGLLAGDPEVVVNLSAVDTGAVIDLSGGERVVVLGETGLAGGLGGDDGVLEQAGPGAAGP